MIPRTVLVTQPDGSLKVMRDPRTEERFSNDMLITLSGQGNVTAQGVVLGNSNVKVGSVLELDGPVYNFKASVVNVIVDKP
jgi:Domain of unknown function (DUF4330)